MTHETISVKADWLMKILADLEDMSVVVSQTAKSQRTIKRAGKLVDFARSEQEKIQRGST